MAQKLIVRLDDGLHSRIADAAQAAGKTVEELVVDAAAGAYGVKAEPAKPAAHVAPAGRTLRTDKP